MPEVRVTVRPRWAFRLPGGAPDGVLRRRGALLERLIHVDGEPVVVRVAQTAADAVLFGARADDRETATDAIDRMRFALGVDADLRAFHDRFRRDPLIGPSVRRRPWLRVIRRPDPFEALAWAITEQLIDFPRAVEIQRRIVYRLGRRCTATGLRDLPDAATVAGTAPALLQSFDLSAGRSLALRKAAREVATGRADLTAAQPHRRRPRARLAAAARDPRHRPLDDRDARAPRPGPPRPGPGRRPQPHQARRPPADRQPARARHRGGGARVLRALRRLGRTRGGARRPRRPRPGVAN